MSLDNEVSELKKKVKEKKETEKLLLEKRKLEAELEKGSVRGLIKKGFKNLWGKYARR